MHLHLSLSDMFLIVDNQFKSMKQAAWAMDSAHSEDTTHRTDSTTATQKQDIINKISSEGVRQMVHVAQPDTQMIQKGVDPGVPRSSVTGSMTCGTCSPRYACIATDPLQIRHLADGQKLWLLLHFFARLLEMQLYGVRGRGRRAGGRTFRLAIIIVIYVKLDPATLAVFLRDVAPTVPAGQRGRVADADQASNRRQITGAPRERHSAGVFASNVVQRRVDVFYSALHVRALKPQAVQLFLDLGHLGINVYGRPAALLVNVISGELPPGEDGRD